MAHLPDGISPGQTFHSSLFTFNSLNLLLIAVTNPIINTLVNIHPDTKQFSFSLSTRQKDWVIIKALEKPFINVLWLGTGVLMIGFVTAMRRRFKELKVKSDSEKSVRAICHPGDGPSG